MKRMFSALVALLLLWSCCVPSAVRAEADPAALRAEETVCSDAAGQEEPELYRELPTDDWLIPLAAGLAVFSAAALAGGLVLICRKKRK